MTCKVDQEKGSLIKRRRQAYAVQNLAVTQHDQRRVHLVEGRLRYR